MKSSSLGWMNDHDTLTSLPNRLFFNETLNKSISYSKRHKKTFALLLIDIDSFNSINGKYGHDIGDITLKEIGSRLAKTIRSEDVLARLDLDQFVVLLNDIEKPKFASTVAEKLLHAISKPIKAGDNEFSVTASIGIAVYPSDGSSLEELLQNADDALFKVKQAQGANYQFHKHELNVEAREYLQLESGLRRALLNNEFILYYQPKLHIKNGNITGVEALIRWMHPALGLLHPSIFLPIAEESGLIMQIGEWALREACRTNKKWQEEGYEYITIAVNLSPSQFLHPNIVQVIKAVLNDTQLNPQYLEIEMTETIVMSNLEAGLAILNGLKAIGVQISIDHFGTGYTSISQLKQFPISVLKIDQNFIKGVPNNPNDSAITTAIIALAHNLGFEVVAEGVETGEQVRFLASQDCDIVQGYYLSHPQPAHKIVLQFRKLMDEVLI